MQNVLAELDRLIAMAEEMSLINLINSAENKKAELEGIHAELCQRNNELAI